MTLHEAIEHAKGEIKAGFAINYAVIGGKLQVETDQGWSIWYAPDTALYAGANDTSGDHWL